MMKPKHTMSQYIILIQNKYWGHHMISNPVIQIVLQITLAGYTQVLRILKETHVKQCVSSLLAH